MNIRVGDGRDDQQPGLRTVIVLGTVGRRAVRTLIMGDTLCALRVSARCMLRVSSRCVFRVSPTAVLPAMRGRRRERRCRHEAEEEGGDQQEAHGQYYTPGGYICARGQGVRSEGGVL